jgi:diguanylate cyclase (GGDEF)-like protein
MQDDIGHPNAPPDSGAPSLSWRRIAVIAGVVGLTYAVLARYIIWLNDPVNAGAGFWPAAGVTLAALLLTPRRAWLPILAAVAVAEIGGDLAQGYPLGATAFWAAGNLIEPLVGAALIRRFRPHAGRLAPLDNLLAFAALGVVAGPLIGASVGSLGTVLWFHLPVWTVWPKYVVGDALGVLVVAPLLLHASTLRLPREQGAEAACFWLMLALIGGLAFRDWHSDWSTALPYFLIPMLVWSALRSTIAATAAAAFLVAQGANLATAHGWGPFALAGDRTGHAVTFLQIYLGIAVGTALILAAMVSDLVSRRELEQQLTHRASHDPLTGLPNRARIHELLERSLVHARNADSSVSVLFCDLDGFKEINDSLGHEWGDRVLVATADRLLAASRARDVVGRLGGDEFVVVCPDLDRVDIAMDVARRLEVAISAPIVHDGRSVRVTASIGLATTHGAASVDEVIHQADTEMYAMKGRRRTDRPRSTLSSPTPFGPPDLQPAPRTPRDPTTKGWTCTESCSLKTTG